MPETPHQRVSDEEYHERWSFYVDQIQTTPRRLADLFARKAYGVPVESLSKSDRKLIGRQVNEMLKETMRNPLGVGL